MTHPETFSDLSDDDLDCVARDIERAAAREWGWAAMFPPGPERMTHLAYAQKLAASARRYRDRIRS